MSNEIDELEAQKVRFKSNGDLVQRVEGAEVVVAHYDRPSGHLEFSSKENSVKLYQQVTARIGSTNKGTEVSGLVIRTIGIKGEPRPSVNPGKKPKMGAEGDGTPILVDWYIRNSLPEAVIRYGIYMDAEGKPVRKRVRRVIELMLDQRESATDDQLPWIKTQARSQEKTPVSRTNKVVELRSAIIARRPTRYEDDQDVLDDLGADKLEALFSPSEVVGGFAPEDEWDNEPVKVEVDQ